MNPFKMFSRNDGDLLHALKSLADFKKKYSKKILKSYSALGDVICNYEEDFEKLTEKIDRAMDKRLDGDAYITKAGDTHVKSSE